MTSCSNGNSRYKQKSPFGNLFKTWSSFFFVSYKANSNISLKFIEISPWLLMFTFLSCLRRLIHSIPFRLNLFSRYNESACRIFNRLNGLNTSTWIEFRVPENINLFTFLKTFGFRRASLISICWQSKNSIISIVRFRKCKSVKRIFHVRKSHVIESNVFENDWTNFHLIITMFE